jgi:Leucine Rich repeats (2 copies)
VHGLKELKALQTLHLSLCEQLTNVDALKQLKALQTLNLSGCKQLAKEAVEELREANISF